MAARSDAAPVHRARSLHDKYHVRLAIFFTLIHYLGVIAVATSLVILMLNPTQSSVPPLVASAAVTGVTWLVSFLRRRIARCPLCKGTPFLDTGASKHISASRIPPLNYGNTAVLSALFLHRFRCMYCGTVYDLLKRSPNERQRH